MSARSGVIGLLALSLITGLMFALGPVTVDMSLPALPAMQQALGAGGGRVELTLTVLFFGLALTQLVYGAVADRYGRRRPLLVGLALYTAASLLAAAALRVEHLAVARLLQALGYGVVIVLIRSAVGDLCAERPAARVFSTAITLMSLSSVIAPAVGGQILVHLGWRAVFAVMAGAGAAAWGLTAVLLPETQPAARRTHQRMGAVFATYAGLLRNGRIAAFAIAAGGAVACQFSFNTAGPSMLIEYYRLSPATAGWLLSLIALSTAAAAQANMLILRRASPEALMLTAVGVLVGAAAALALVTFGHIGGVTVLACVLFVLAAVPGVIVPNAMAAALSSAGDQAGAASALIGVMQFILGTLGSGIVGYFHDPSGRVLSSVVLALSVATLACALGGRRAQLSAAAPLQAAPLP